MERYKDLQKYTFHKNRQKYIQQYTRHTPKIHSICIQIVRLLSADFGSICYFAMFYSFVQRILA